MSKLKTSIDEHLKRRKVIQLAGKGQVKMVSAPWVDTELIDHIKYRSFLNKEWRKARARGEPECILKRYKEKYLEQKRITALMTGDKKSKWESNKIQETWKDSKKLWVMHDKRIAREEKRDGG